MAATQEDDMYLFNAGLDQTATTFSAHDFEPFLEPSADAENEPSAVESFFSLSDLIKEEPQASSPADLAVKFPQLHRGSGSSSSSAQSGNFHHRNPSEVSATSSAAIAGREKSAWGSGINGLTMPATTGSEHFFDDSTMTGIDQDFEASNKQMASDFDFDTAASTPSGFDAAALAAAAKSNGTQALKQGTAKLPRYTQASGPSPKMTTSAQPAFFFAGSREASPLNAMLPGAQGHSPWNKHSPSSGLEETFNHITMNGDSPGNTTLSPNHLQFSSQPFRFEPESSSTPSPFSKDISSPPSTVNSSTADGVPRLTVHPTSLKSRVETQIPIKLTLSCLPPGVKKLHLPIHTVSKPKFLVKGGVERSPEMLELHTSLVCTSAMQDPVKLERALARARGEDPGPFNKPSPAGSSTSSSSSRDDDDRPLNGGEVKICAGCIQRERKRASRKKQKKPDEEEAFQKDEEKRVVVFNTNEVKEWTDGSKDASSAHSTPLPAATNSSGALYVELPMRIACYCRHQNEKMGFQVIFTIKDYRDKLVAQAMTNSIMITDDHKTHNSMPPAPQVPVSLPTAPQVPGAGVFAAGAESSAATPPGISKMFKQSFSTNDLYGLQNNFTPNLSMPPSRKPFAIPSGFSADPSATMAARNLSRPASPSGPTGPTSKKRKQSNSGKLPSALTMTPLDTLHDSSSLPMAMPNPTSAGNTYVQPLAASRLNPAATGTSPPTPNGAEPYAASINRSFSLDNLARQGVISAPASRQPSRPGSPGSARNSFGATDAHFGQAVSNQLLTNNSNTSRRPPPLIHKLVPAEGSVTGGTEVTLLGNGFYQGLEVMFGDTEATTTTFWGEKCLNCIAPPSLQHGTVAVVFKHEHPQYATVQPSQTRSTVFTYIDDRELEILRLAVRTIGKQMQLPTDDPFSAAQQLLQGQQQQSLWGAAGAYGGGIMGAHQRAAGLKSAPMDTLELENVLVALLDFVDKRAPTALQRLDIRRPSGLTLLHLASSLGLTRFVAGLLARGANPNLADKNGNTAMHHAAINGHTHIIHRLRLAGGNHHARCLRGFMPADLATSLLAYQAALTPPSHYRSRSAGGTPLMLHSRRGSTASLRSFWETASTSYLESDAEEFSSGEVEALELVNASAISLPPSRRASMKQSAAGTSLPAVLTTPSVIEGNATEAPPAFMLAWRDHLVAQLQQFNESAQSVMPSLATLNVPLHALQEYQASPMVRRVSSLFPHMPSSSRQNAGGQKEGWWETLTGNSSPVSSAPATEASAPPAYDDLYPDKLDSDQDWSTKKQSAVRAVMDVMADQHFEAQASGASKSAAVEPSSDGEGAGSVLVRRRKTQRIELSQDRKLFFFWIPILLILLFLMVRSSGLGELLRQQYQGRQGFDNVVEVAV